MTIKRGGAFIALLLAFALVAAACGDSAETTTTTAAPTDTEATTTTAPPETTTTTAAATTTTAAATTTTTLPPPPPGRTVLACQVSDTGGIDDKSFNETAWNGALAAQEQLEGVTVEFLESQAATDFRPNIDSFIAAGCDVIVTVGFLLADDTAAAAFDNPDSSFAIIDYPSFVAPFVLEDGAATSNVRGLNFNTDEAAFLAGYLSAGMSETGVVGTFGGINIPPVTIFMDGFVRGVNHYNTIKGTEVIVLGWDPDTQEGLFTNNFESLDDGRAFGQNLLDEGADIILPVAGPVGLGTAAVCQESAGCLVIGVDADQYLSAPEFGDVFLTSIQKNMDAAVFNTIQNVLVLGALGNEYFGTLGNGGVGLAPYHDFENVVPAELQAEVIQLAADIVSGVVVVVVVPEE